VQTRPEYFHERRGDGLTITGDTDKSAVGRAHVRWHHQPSRLGEEKGVGDLNGKNSHYALKPNPDASENVSAG
jgi:hypothetical protein